MAGGIERKDRREAQGKKETTSMASSFPDDILTFTKR